MQVVVGVAAARLWPVHRACAASLQSSVRRLDARGGAVLLGLRTGLLAGERAGFQYGVWRLASGVWCPVSSVRHLGSLFFEALIGRPDGSECIQG